MLDLNIRNMPDGLIKRLKIQAAILGQSLREYVIDALVTSVNADEGEWIRLSATHDQPARPTASQQAQQQVLAGKGAAEFCRHGMYDNGRTCKKCLTEALDNQ